GAAALADEVLWARDFALLYGITATGTAVVLAAYFGGLALGSLLGGSLGERTRGLRAWAAFEGGVALSVLAYLALRPGLPAAAAWAARTPLPGARVLLAFGVLLVPTTLLGATDRGRVGCTPGTRSAGYWARSRRVRCSCAGSACAARSWPRRWSTSPSPA